MTQTYNATLTNVDGTLMARFDLPALPRFIHVALVEVEGHPAGHRPVIGSDEPTPPPTGEYMAWDTFARVASSVHLSDIEGWADEKSALFVRVVEV